MDYPIHISKVMVMTEDLRSCEKGIDSSDGSACCSMAHGGISRTCVMCFLHVNLNLKQPEWSSRALTYLHVTSSELERFRELGVTLKRSNA